MNFSLCATGDSFVCVSQPADSIQVDEQIQQSIAECDVRLTNLETIIRRDEGAPSAQSGGTWASSLPESLDLLKKYHFNALSMANNHSLDYAIEGMQATRRYADATGFVHSGTGDTLSDAAAPATLLTAAGKVALISGSSTFHPSWLAADPRAQGPGRPGLNPLRFKTRYGITSEQMEALKQIAKTTLINAQNDTSIKDGFLTAPPPEIFSFGSHDFFIAEPDACGEFTTPQPEDLVRLTSHIEAAAASHDLVVVSIHSHEPKDGRKDLPAQFLIDYAHAAIDAGAHAVIGHGPHVLRGIEIYRNRPILYSLGNFIFQNEAVAWLPSDYYAKYKIDSSLSTKEAFATRSAHNTRGFAVQPKIWQTVLARMQFENGSLAKLVLDPLALNRDAEFPQRGLPEPTTTPDAFQQIITLSKPFKTTFSQKNNQLIWTPSV